MSRKEILGLFLVLLVAIFFRFNQLNRVPPSPSLDEVSLGWNAYSILQTGADEYGTRFPVLLRAYDDWRPALYVYLIIPFVKLFGLTAVSVRLPSVLLSLITILATYFLAKELFRPPAGEAGNSRLTSLVSLIASFLLAISPWHIYLSRLGHEVNAGLTLAVLGIFFFVKFVNSVSRKTLFLLLAALFWALSFYTYQSLKIFGPLMIALLAVIYRRELWQFKKQAALAVLLGVILMAPILKASLAPEAMIRFGGTRAPLSTIPQSYFSHFNPVWLFTNGGEEKHKVPGMGLFYPWELPLLLIGIYKLMTGKFSRSTKLLLMGWLVIAPLPASIATEAPHAMRAFNALPVPQIISAIGLAEIIFNFQFSIFKNKVGRILFAGMVLIFLLANLGYLYRDYFIIFPRQQSASFQYPLSQALPYVLKEADQYEKIVFANQGQLYQSYMFFLFYARYDPKLYQSRGGTVSGGFAETHRIGKYEFRPLNWGKEVKDNTLFIGNVHDFPAGSGPAKTFSLLNGQKAIAVYFSRTTTSDIPNFFLRI